MSEEEKELSEEELLEQWQDMASDEEGGEGADASDQGAGDLAEGGLPERILDQDEIDSLLGIDSDEDHGGVGIRALLDTSVVNYERLPMLDVLFDKFERYLSTSLRHFTADNVDITVDSITTVRFGDFLSSIPLPAGIVVVNAIGLDDYILMIYESRLIYAVVDILLGGRKARPARIEGRNFTTIERRIMDNLSDVVLNDLSEAFAPVAPVQFTAERMEVNPRFANITREGNAAILVTVRVNLEERDGIIQFCIPYGTLEPIREQLLQQFMGEKFGQDNIWESHLAQELFYTNVPLKVVLDEETFSLKDVLQWRLGDTIPLHTRPGQPVSLYCGHEKKLEGQLGKMDDFKAIKVTKNINDVNNEESEKH
ncbi:MAG: flagellar motor switch protein FliM [Magnetococcales bacterium]|nr:flagellar motor switch protein FliM [Magnetococcales bacterium]MEC8067392.1 flagellar motor switch protein FliM [Pseudomonadota bacterium]|tara:strand:- start:15319 stop:16425 length:1107 start_codon:yes stop_codon:yes gene_type:complete